jgi:hypothetical protein
MVSSFTNGTDKFLWALSPGNQPDGLADFPANIGSIHFENSDRTIHQWFSRCVGLLPNNDPEYYSLDDENEIAAFATIKWKDRRLTYVNCQFLILSGMGLSEFLRHGERPNSNAQYLRLDYDETCLGPIFKEPLPHIHSNPMREPRFPLESIISGNMIVDFLSFVFRNYKHDTWLKWTRKRWERFTDYPVDSVIYAFMASKTDDMSNRYCTYIREMRACLRQEMSNMNSSFRMSSLGANAALQNLVNF